MNKTKPTLISIAASLDRHNARFEQITSTLGTVINKVDALEKTVSTLNGKFTKLDARVFSLENKVSALDNKVTKLDGRVFSLENKVTMLDNKVTKLDGRVFSLENKVSALDNKVTKLDSRVVSLENKVAKLDDKFSALDGKVTRLDKKVVTLDKSVRALTKSHTLLVESHRQDSARLLNLEFDMAELKTITQKTAYNTNRILSALDNLLVGKVKTYDTEHAAIQSALNRHDKRICALEMGRPQQDNVTTGV